MQRGVRAESHTGRPLSHSSAEGGGKFLRSHLKSELVRSDVTTSSEPIRTQDATYTCVMWGVEASSAQIQRMEFTVKWETSCDS